MCNNTTPRTPRKQALSVPEILAGGDFLVASHTGSGKTLAYLLPILEQLKRAEAAGAPRRARRPRALVLGPTVELVEQLKRAAKALSHTVKFSSVALTSHGGKGEQRAALGGPVDVVFATPTRALQHNADGALFFGDVRWLVVDEADTMIAKGFLPEVTKIVGAVKGRSSGSGSSGGSSSGGSSGGDGGGGDSSGGNGAVEDAQVVFVSATAPPAVQKLMRQALPGMKPLETRTLHRAVAGSRHQFVTVPPGGDKRALAVQLVQGDAAKGRRVLAFCGTVSSCRALEHYCRVREGAGRGGLLVVGRRFWEGEDGGG